jgi:ribosomal protein S18 acetylase RimI-like enzyme
MLGELNVSVSGLVSPLMHRALAQAGARGEPGVIALVATVGGEPAGFVVATRDSGRFWPRLLLRHPTLAIRVLLSRRRQRGAASPTGAAAGGATAEDADPTLRFPQASHAAHAWADDGPSIVKIIFIGVRPAFRQRGVGDLLYRRLFEEAAMRGAHAVLARIARDNAASIRLHEAAGWQLYRDSTGILAVRPVSTPRSQSTPA